MGVTQRGDYLGKAWGGQTLKGRVVGVVLRSQGDNCDLVTSYCSINQYISCDSFSRLDVKMFDYL